MEYAQGVGSGFCTFFCFAVGGFIIFGFFAQLKFMIPTSHFSATVSRYAALSSRVRCLPVLYARYEAACMRVLVISEISSCVACVCFLCASCIRTRGIGLQQCHDVAKICAYALCLFYRFAQLNDKMGGDLSKIKEVGKYFLEVWRACGMDLGTLPRRAVANSRVAPRVIEGA